jgi:hypothetical protein
VYVRNPPYSDYSLVTDVQFPGSNNINGGILLSLGRLTDIKLFATPELSAQPII